MREAMRATGTVGISRLVLYRRERAVMLQPRGKGIVLWTLRYGREVRDESDYFDAIKQHKVDRTLLKLVKELIDKRTQPWDERMVRDPVQERLLDIISAKQKGRKKPSKKRAPEDDTASGNVVSIMDALRKSIASETGRSKRK